MVELKQFDGQAKEELAMVDVAHALLQTSGQVTEFNDLLAEVAEFLELEDNELEAQMAQFYTDLNIDGRFISLGANRWGLRGWYPVDSIDEELTHDNDEEDEKPRRSKDGFDDYEVAIEEEYEEEEEEDEEEEDEETIEYGDRVDVDEHGVMVDDEDEEDLGEYKEDLEELEDADEDELEGLSVVDDEDVLEDEEED